ncbi:MAG: hypothetical protein NTY98_04885 [Verrucomicrobia bacterium]|nr:hypothetical protein [Verrucomicrobiota bacterium]
MRSRFAHWRAPLQSFLVGQPAIQLLNLITGFFLIRWLDVNEFAMFGMAFAFQSTVTQLTDLGFSGSIIALAGSRGRDSEVLGSYLRSARNWRSKMQGMVLLIAAIVFPLITWTQPWGYKVKCLLFGTVVLGVLFQGWTMYGAPLLVHRELQKYYRPQIHAAVLRLALNAGFYAMGVLSAWAAALLAALSLGYTGFNYRRSSQAYIREPQQSEPERNSEMLRYLSPLIPGVVFTALQGQILVGISAIFGTTQNLAEISALGRVGQLFLILGAFNAVFVEPYIAGVPRALLARRYCQILTAALGIACIIGTVGFLLPQPLLWLLGRNYAGLEREIGWVVLSACISYVGGVMWTMHAARRWLFWWGTGAYITTMIVTQTLCITLMDLSQTLPIVWFGVITCTVGIFVHAATGFYGFLITHREHLPESY